MFRFIMILIASLGTAVSVPAAECLDVSDNQVEEMRTEYGMSTIEWSAEVRNECDVEYDGTLTVRLLDSEGEVLHEALEIIILQNNSTKSASKRITLPAENYEALDEISVGIRERERPH